MAETRKLEYRVAAKRIDANGSEATAKQARLTLDTNLSGRLDAFNPVELLLASLAACMLKGIERVAPMLKFRFDGAAVTLTAQRQDAPPKLISVDYEIAVTTSETDQRLDLLHRNILKYGTISNTLAGALTLSGSIRRA